MWLCAAGIFSFIVVSACLLCRMVLAMSTEVVQWRRGASSYGLCRVYSFNVQLGTEHRHGADERHFFACCSDADVNSCHDQTLQDPRRDEGTSCYVPTYLLRTLLLPPTGVLRTTDQVFALIYLHHVGCTPHMGCK